MDNDTIQSKVDVFLKENGIEKVIAFSGGSDEQQEVVARIIEDSVLYFKGLPVAVLTGGTSWGLPKFATVIAKDYGLKTIGVLPERGGKYSLGAEMLDLELVVPPRFSNSEFGDESEVFAKLSDAIEILGGSLGTPVEFYHAMKINERRLDPKYGETPIYIAPISGIGGFSDTVMELDLPERVRPSLPSDKIYYGGDAAKFLLHKLDLNKMLRVA